MTLIKLSDHVSLAEFEGSSTARSTGIDNKMNDVQIASATLLCEKVFEPLRAYIDEPIRITSGYRSAKLNKSIGGSTSSQHCKGEAMDLHIDRKGFEYIKDNLDFDQLIWEFGTTQNPDWVHVSYKKIGNRKQILKATKKNGKTIYSAY